jgi:hypothetical protein
MPLSSYILATWGRGCSTAVRKHACMYVARRVCIAANSLRPDVRSLHVMTAC